MPIRARRSSHRFVCNQVRALLFVLAYKLGNFLRRLALPKRLKHWSLRSLHVRLIKMKGRMASHARQILFQLAEMAVSREPLAPILVRIDRLRPVPV
ncbi:MAG: transposase [Nitrospinota bacterium]